MNKKREKELKAKGFQVTTVADFLDLTPEDMAVIEFKRALSKALKAKRLKAKASQVKFAKRLKTSQSRLAKMEAGDKSVSLDLLIRNLVKIGYSPEEIPKLMAKAA